MLKQILAVVAGALFGAAIFAADVVLKQDHPDTYIVQKGDTLWDISARFLNQPWLWPEIWQANPQIQNPHLIYPGDRLSLVYVGGQPRLQLGDGGDFGPRIRRESLSDAVTAVPYAAVQPFLEKMRIFDKSEMDKAPYVVALEEERLRSTVGQTAYVRGLDAPAGTRVLIVRPTYVYYDVPEKFPWGSSARKVRAEPWEADRSHTAARWWKERATNFGYRRHVEYLGHEVQEVGSGQVLRGGDPSTVLIEFGDFEVRKGDLVLIGSAAAFDLTFYPHAPDQVPENLRVISFTDALDAVGPHQVVALSKGARDGIENGQVFSVFQPGSEIRDDVKYPSDDVRTLFRPSKAKVRLPDEYVANVMVFRTFEKVSYGLVMSGIRPVKIYDHLQAPVN
jgi:LysM domain